jgi:penicillin-binding protein 1B
MLELKMIDAEQAKTAKASPLPNRPERSLTEPAPYFVQAVRRELTFRGIDETQGLKVYTTLNLRAQETADQSIRAGLDQLETTKPSLKKLKAQGKNLEAVLISANPQTGAIEALVGGRGYIITQFNRATDSRRQVGSVMKPFVYLTAFESRTIDGKPYTPLTLIPDKATTLKFEGQSWSPHNFEGEFNGNIPIFWALKESINAATVNLGMDVGLDNIIDMTKRLGITSAITPLPSLTLGAFEMSPIEVLQAYSAMSLMGMKTELTLIHSVENLTHQELYRHTAKLSPAVAPDAAAELVGVMKQTIINGTGKSIPTLGFTHPAAGKTGTTNDRKDSWFAGFTPFHTAVVWVGYDDNTSHGLTGATGAVPIWANYMKNYATSYPAKDFNWPEGVEKITLTPEQQLSYGVPAKSSEKLENIELVFKKGQFPPH